MGKPLIIVEAPAKAKSISGYLQGQYTVIATVGHFCDVGVDDANIVREANGAWHLYPQITPDKKQIWKRILSEIKNASEVIIATDGDREGEVIGYNVALKAKLPKSTRRLVIKEITPEGCQKALASPRGTIDIQMVRSGEARRALDRIIGFTVSSYVRGRVDRKTLPVDPRTKKAVSLSAGRVQTAVLRFIVDREIERETFKPEPIWKIAAALEGGCLLKSEIFHQKPPHDFEAANPAEVTIKTVDREGKPKVPPPPLITSTLLEEAAQKFGFAAEKTQRIAQTLYEGIDVPGHGRLGLITYIRTDSPRMEPEAVNTIRGLLKKLDPKLVPGKARVYKGSAGAQDAHECLRPTHFEILPKELDGIAPPRGLTDEDLKKVYGLIYARAVASQAEDAIDDVINIGAEWSGVPLKGTFTREISRGWRKVLGTKAPSDPLPEDIRPSTVSTAELTLEADETKPPSAYTEPTLIKYLKKSGVGRPSTYAGIMGTLVNRKYITRKGKNIQSTELGREVLREVLLCWQDQFNAEFTSHMEDVLDKIADGADRDKALDGLVKPFVGKAPLKGALFHKKKKPAEQADPGVEHGA
jgi:DNA topoisomerase-1